MEKNFSPQLQPGIMARGNRIYRMLSVGGILLLSLILVSAAAAQEYNAADVDTKPKLIRMGRLAYPPLAKRTGVEGKVLVHVLISAKGKAEKMEVVESEPEGVFDEAALNSLKYSQFRPGIKGGETVATWANVPVTFTLEK